MSVKTVAKPSHNAKFHEYLKRLAARILTFRRRTGSTMEELAQACGVTRGTIHKMEHPPEHEDLSLATTWTVAQHFGISLSDLLKDLDADRPGADSQTVFESADWLEPEDHLALRLVSEVTALQIRADLAEQACLVAKDERQLEALASHSAKLRQRRYSLLLKQRGGV